MPRSLLPLLAAAGMFALAACSDRSPLTGPAPAPTPALNVVSDQARHLFLTRDGYLQAAQHNGRPVKNGSNGISYHGGPVLQAWTNVAAVYWAPAAYQPVYTGGPAAGASSTSGTSGDGSEIARFLNALGGSPYFNINTTYYNGSGVHIANVVHYTQYWASTDQAPDPTSTASVSDAQMVQVLQDGFNSGALQYDANTLYAIFSAGKANLGGGFGTQYCAYHTHGTVTIGGVSKNVLYAAMPYDAQYPSGCTNSSGYPNNDPADAEVNTLAHETEETTTDEMGNAWYDTRGYENADKCAWTWGSTYTTANGATANINLGGYDYLVQQNWVNASGGYCAMKY